MQTGTLKSYVLLGVGAAALWMAVRPNNNKLNIMTSKMKQKITPIKDKLTPSRFKAPVLPVDKAGNPDPIDLEDNKMVSEGSQYGVHYYNETLQHR
ncbi:hypothetical protein [Bacillus sp. T33-2]|uniref:hypothetical protein n=1 Tax=Bacillus sp. T33-2 TaxID=2054168 RepID=UPI000C78F628|nr:hypothetical protein [Bacillus sp. T33-2]